ncbi:ankyrin repeat-containing domain protein [Daldinia eschscholtzii]|nr:ankyrin repeat-containing domain protein [Daldinia eschscholtzii]
MDINIQLPGNAVERRRLQNRIAQRRFRQKKENKRHVVVGEGDIHTHSEARPSLGAPITGPQNQIQSQPSQPHDVVPQYGSINSPGFLTTASSSLEAGGGSDNVTQIETSFWDPNAIDNLLSSTVTGLTSNTTPPSPSQFLQELDITPQGVIGTDVVNSTGAAHPPHNDIDAPQESLASNSIRRPLRYRRSARLKETLESVRGDDDEGWLGALHIAAQSGRARMIDILVEQGEDINERDSDGRTPLVHAVISGHEDVVQLLLARGALIAVVDRDARSVLHWAALYQREGMLRMFLEWRSQSSAVDRPDVDAYDDSGWTPLHMAICRDFEAGVRLLLKAGARLDSKAQKCPFARKLNALGLSQ